MSSKSKVEIKRYNLSLPQNLYDEIQGIADSEGTTALEIMRRFIKLGLVVTRLSDESESELIVRQGERERELILV